MGKQCDHCTWLEAFDKNSSSIHDKHSQLMRNVKTFPQSDKHIWKTDNRLYLQNNMFSLRAQGYPFLCLLQFIILSIVEDLGSAVGQGNEMLRGIKSSKNGSNRLYL